MLNDLLSSTTGESIKSKHEEAKAKLESLYGYITEGIILRSRTTWYEKGEKSNKYFLNLEKRNKSKTHIRSLVTSIGEKHLTQHLYWKNSKHFMGNSTGADLSKLRHSAMNISKR